MSALPKLHQRKDGKTSYIYVGKKKVYLGKTGDPETTRLYLEHLQKVQERNNSEKRRVALEAKKSSAHPLLSKGRRRESVPTITGSTRQRKKECPTMIERPVNTLESVLTAFIQFYEDKNRKRPFWRQTHRAEVDRAKLIRDRVREWCPGILAEDFDAFELIRFRERLEETGYISTRGVRCHYSRNYLNKLVNNVRAVYAWGVGRRLVTRESHHVLHKTYVKPLYFGETDAPESPERTDVKNENVEIVCKYLQPIYRDIIRLLELTGMRPKELCDLSWDQIDQSDPTAWIYKPVLHKNACKNKTRYIGFGSRCQAILLKYREEKGCIFTPRAVLLEHWAIQTANRTTPARKSRSTGTKLAKCRDRLSSDLISKAVRKAVRKAIENDELSEGWTPYCLRHKRVTEQVDSSDIHEAQTLAGHSSPITTQIYDHTDIKIIKRIAREKG